MRTLVKAGRSLAAVPLALVMALAPVGPFVRPAGASHQPADKIGVSASVVEVMNTTASPLGPSSSEVIELLSATLRTSSPTDLMLKVTAECALWTDIVSPESQASATVNLWVEIDGQRVPVTFDANDDGVFDDPDDGAVVFCNRDFQISSLIGADVLRLYLRTKSANAFNWVTFDVQSGIHTVAVKARLDVHVSGTGLAKAAVGKRTLIVEPAKLANDATI